MKKVDSKLVEQIHKALDEGMGKSLTPEEESKLITKEVTIGIRFTEEQYEEIEEIARDFDTTDGEIIEFIVTSGLLKKIDDDNFIQLVRDEFFKDSTGLDF